MSADGAETGKDILLVLKPGNRRVWNSYEKRISIVSYMDEWTKAPFCVMINRNNCDNYSVDRICEVTEQLQITTERGIFDGIYIRK